MTASTGDVKTSWDIPNLVHEKCQIKASSRYHLFQASCYWFRWKLFRVSSPNARLLKLFHIMFQLENDNFCSVLGWHIRPEQMNIKPTCHPVEVPWNHVWEVLPSSNFLPESPYSAIPLPGYHYSLPSLPPYYYDFLLWFFHSLSQKYIWKITCHIFFFLFPYI